LFGPERGWAQRATEVALHLSCYYTRMLTSSLDILEKAQLPAPQAKAILRVMELELSAQHGVLETKTDLLTIKADLLKTDLLAVKADLLAFKAELKADIAAVRSDLELKIEAAKAETARLIIGSSGVLLGAIYFLLNYARK